MKTIIKILLVVLVVGVIVSAVLWQRAREDALATAQKFAEHEQDRVNLQAGLLKVHIDAASDLYESLKKAEQTAYTFNSKIANGDTQRLLSDTIHAVNLLQIEMQYDRSLREAREKYR